MKSDLPNGKEVELVCPKCVPPPKLVMRTNRQNGSQFLGCQNYPMCNFTMEIPEHIRLRAQGQPTLFG